MAAPQNNKPEETDNQIDTELEKKVTESIKQSLAEFDVVKGNLSKYNTTKIQAMKSIGSRITTLHKEQSEKVKRLAMKSIGSRITTLHKEQSEKVKRRIFSQFQDALGASSAQLYKFIKVDIYFTDKQIQELVKAEATVRTLDALISIDDEKKRMALFEGVINGTITDDEIRFKKGTKGSRKKQGTKRALEADRKKPPFRVFSKAIDKVAAVSDTIMSSTEAITRLDQSSDVYDDSLNALTSLRDRLKSIQEEITTFLKHTKKFEK